MAFDWISSVIGFLVGTATGAAGTYFAEKYTDQRRTKEQAKHLKDEFFNLKIEMPDLISEFKNDLSQADNRLIREFFILPNKRVCFGGSEKPRFIYYEDEHKNLRGKIDMLENSGFLTDMTYTNTPMYRMTEEFVSLVERYG